MIKKIVISIESFLLTIFIFALIILTVISMTIFNKKYVLNVLETNNYYETTYYNLKDTLEGYTIQSGLDTSLFENLIDLEKVENDINILIDGIYDNKEIKIDTNIIKERLESIIANKLKENNRIPLKEEQESIEDFINTILEVYEGEIVYSRDFVLKIQEVYPKLNIFLNNLILFIILITIFLLITIVIICKIKLSIKIIGISLLTTSLLLITLWFLLETRFQHILIINLAFSKVLISILSDIINKYFYSGLVVFIIGLMGIIFGSVEKK